MEILHSVLSYGSNSVYYQRPRTLLLTPTISPVATPPPPPHVSFDSALNNSFLRFPTPPVTPPLRSSFSHCADPKKIGQGLSTPNFISSGMSSCQETEIENATSSESSSPSSEHICQWTDCGSYFKSLDSLASHVTQVHAVPLSDGLYYCRWNGCPRSERGFNARYKMLVHVRTHTKEKPHQCHLCEKSFSRAENLKIHLRSHSGEKPYVCNYEGCNKAYSNSSDRFKHTRTHILEKPYVCKVPGCQKRYTDPSSLRKHVKTFKHSVQIIDSKHLDPNATAQASENFEIHARRHRCQESTKSENYQPTSLQPLNHISDAKLFATTAGTTSEPLPSYIYNYALPSLPPYDVCRGLERTHLDYIYPAEAIKPNFWSHESFLTLGYPSSCAISSHRPMNTLVLDTPLDLPLDLRTHRK